jgi:hypothetical protein
MHRAALVLALLLAGLARPAAAALERSPGLHPSSDTDRLPDPADGSAHEPVPERPVLSWRAVPTRRQEATHMMELLSVRVRELHALCVQVGLRGASLRPLGLAPVRAQGRDLEQVWPLYRLVHRTVELAGAMATELTRERRVLAPAAASQLARELDQLMGSLDGLHVSPPPTLTSSLEVHDAMAEFRAAVGTLRGLRAAIAVQNVTVKPPIAE